MNSWSFFTAKEIKPRGWLRRQLEIQAAGLSGNLDKIWPDVRDSAWIGGDREGWERVPYWLDGFIPLAYLLDNEDMIKRARKYMDAILSSQQPDGWICPCSEEKRETYDTWAVQLISKVLTVYYSCSGDARIPEVLYRVLKNYHALLAAGKVKLFDWGKSRWFEAFIAINFTYERWPEQWLKELAQILFEQGMDYASHAELWKCPLNKWRFETHIVNLAMMLKAEAVSCTLLGNAYEDKAEQLRSLLAQYNGTVYESFTGDECLSGLSPIQGTELCAIVEQMYSYELLYAYTGDSKWAERLEVLAFNALPATISDDMWTHQYDQMSNQIACQRFPGKPLFRTNGEEAHLFGLEPNYGCCTANFNQGWPKFALSAFLYRGNTVRSAWMIPSELQTEDFRILLETEYPFENRMKYCISAGKPFCFQIRIPSFAQNLKVNGNQAEAGVLEFEIEPGTTEILVDFETSPYFQSRPYDLHAVRCGSLIFSVPIQHRQQMREYVKDGVERKYPYCDYELIPEETWNYGFASGCLSVQRHGVGTIPFANDTPPVTVKAALREIEWGLADGYETVCAKIPESRTAIGETKIVELYPYGCAKLRMTELPFVEE